MGGASRLTRAALRGRSGEPFDDRFAVGPFADVERPLGGTGRKLHRQAALGDVGDDRLVGGVGGDRGDAIALVDDQVLVVVVPMQSARLAWFEQQLPDSNVLVFEEE